MTTGVTFSAFDLLHAGHMLFLNRIIKEVDNLIIGLHVDPAASRPWKHSPHQGLLDRYMQLENFLESKGVKFRIVPYETEEDILNILAIYGIDVRFIGSDYVGKDFTGKKEFPDIKICYVDRKYNFSSTKKRAEVAEEPIKWKTPIDWNTVRIVPHDQYAVDTPFPYL